MFSIGRHRASIEIFVLALTCAAVTGTAFARSAYDGDWSVVIATNSGACGPARSRSYASGCFALSGRWPAGQPPLNGIKAVPTSWT